MSGKVAHIPDVLADPEYEAIGYQKISGSGATLASR